MHDCATVGARCASAIWMKATSLSYFLVFGVQRGSLSLTASSSRRMLSGGVAHSVGDDVGEFVFADGVALNDVGVEVAAGEELLLLRFPGRVLGRTALVEVASGEG